MLKFLVFLSLLGFSVAEAQEVHFFGSLDYAKTTTKNNVNYVGIGNHFSSANLTTAGINVSAKVDNHSQALVQVIHSPLPNKIVVDLVQLQRSFPHRIKARVGHQRLPTFLKSEVIQVKALYPWTNAPVEVYNQVPVKTFTGASLEKELGNFGLHIYGGNVNDELFQDDSRTEVSGRKLKGARLNFLNKNFSAYVNYLKNETDLEIYNPVQIAPGVMADSKLVQKLKDLEVYTTGFMWDDQRWLVMSEFIKIYTRNSLLKSIEGGYASVGRHFLEDFLLLGTFSKEFTRVSNLSPSKGTTYDLTLQYTFDLNTVLKIGASHVDHQDVTVASPFSPTGTTNSGNGLSGSPGNNFQVYDLQLAFVF